MQVVGVAFGNALLDEFSSTKASKVGLSWEFHHKTKLYFEVCIGGTHNMFSPIHADLQV